MAFFENTNTFTSAASETIEKPQSDSIATLVASFSPSSSGTASTFESSTSTRAVTPRTRIYECPHCGKNTFATAFSMKRHITHHCKKNVRTYVDGVMEKITKLFGTTDMKQPLKMPERPSTTPKAFDTSLKEYVEKTAPTNQQPEAQSSPKVDKEDHILVALLQHFLSKQPQFDKSSQESGLQKIQEKVEEIRGSEHEVLEEVEVPDEQLEGSGHSEEDGPSTLETSEEAAEPSTLEQDQYIPHWFNEHSAKPILLDAADEVLEDSDDEEVVPTTTTIPSIPISNFEVGFRTARMLQPEQTLQEYLEPSTSEQDQYAPHWFNEHSSKPLLLEAADEVLEDSDDEEIVDITPTIPSIPISKFEVGLRSARMLQPELTLQDYLASRENPVTSRPVKRPSAQSSKSPVLAAPAYCTSCKMCEMVVYSRAELNNHLIMDHGYVRCRMFATGGCATVLTNKRGEGKHFRRLHKSKATEEKVVAPPKIVHTFSKPPASLNPVQKYLKNRGRLAFSEEHSGSGEPQAKRGKFNGSEGEESAALAAFLDEHPWMK